jgi:hypothetical protein
MTLEMPSHMTAAEARKLAAKFFADESEGDLQRRCVTALRDLGWFVSASANGIKCTPRQMSIMKSRGLVVGFPDIQALKPGRVVFIELKTPTGIVSDAQHICHSTLRVLGFEVYVCTSLDEVLEAVA